MGLPRRRTQDAIKGQFELLALVTNGQEISLFYADDFRFELLCPNTWNNR
jgi:hypothetical protein